MPFINYNKLKLTWLIESDIVMNVSTLLTCLFDYSTIWWCSLFLTWEALLVSYRRLCYYRAYTNIKMHFVPSRTFKSGTLAISTHCWIWWSRNVASSLRVSTRPTCILVCGRPRLPGTPRTWTSTASTTCTLGSPSPGN